MLYDIPKGPGLEVVTHGFNPMVHPNNGLGQTNPKGFTDSSSVTRAYERSIVRGRDPYKGLSGPAFGWEKLVQDYRRAGMGDAYVNDNPRLSGLSGWLDNVVQSVSGQIQGLTKTTVETLGQVGSQKVTSLFSKPAAPSTPAAQAPMVVYAPATAAPSGEAEVLGVPAKYFAWGALAVLGATIYAKLK